LGECSAAAQCKGKAARAESPAETDRAVDRAVKACRTHPSRRAQAFRVLPRQAGPVDRDRAVDLLRQVRVDMVKATAAIFPDKAAQVVSQDMALQAVLADKAVQVDSPIRAAQADLLGKAVRAGFLDRALRADLAGKALPVESPVRVAEA
jgi:hypothetical protein